ncbi:MAG TPA: hypothetical protein PLL26_04480 [Candidatus Dojkabacteria bacterium]|nr:hypothetical protein [Candidatus Dojkabacteria bacterium]
MIDTKFNFYSDARGGDPDNISPTLREYHKRLWSKPLPSGKIFDLSNDKSNVYLYHKSEIGEFFLGSDAITHSYKYHKRKCWIISQIPKEVDYLFDIGSTIGAYIIFPNNRIKGSLTINQARGVNSLIDDRFDLTLECIRLFYLEQKSPLYNTLLRYKSFFDLFHNFINYIHFFLLDDLIDNKQNIKFYLPFTYFQTRPSFSNTDEYLLYKERVTNFVRSRNKRIENYVKIKNSLKEITELNLST